ncbi:hypothetical protein KJ762_06870 [bacterium]|nr:hypothetical protein [bacterium]MBU1065826.1 hypothetical protein [bacterium]MBU1634216.1 hypothetical protein [bacterium]MBU1874208.1 hypothetical protein [bacterium]
MKNVYVFKVALKHVKGLWRRIEIRSDQTLGNFDRIIRDAFNHDTWDHLGEFYKERWSQGGYGEIYPDGKGSGTGKQIEQLGLSEGDKFGYVYDFGDEIHHILTLEKIMEPEKGVKYPRVISKNKPNYRYCETCKKQGQKTIAKWICIECSEDKESDVILCEDCMEEHEDHFVDEILY